MEHRHLNHERFTLAAIDDVISRGKMQDWFALRRAARAEPEVREDIARVCRAHVADPYAQRYWFWLHYVQERR